MLYLKEELRAVGLTSFKVLKVIKLKAAGAVQFIPIVTEWWGTAGGED